MIDVVLAWLALILAAWPALLFLRNLRHHRPPPGASEVAETPLRAVSVLIPARNEERSIVAAVRSALVSEEVEVEVVVLDDDSTDRTAALVEELARDDERVRLLYAPPLPAGWCGKQHACWILAGQARHSLLLFLDADVRLAPDGLARLVRFLTVSRADLVSGIPHQETVGFLEKLVLPLIHFVLLGFLPLHRMRHHRTTPGYAAGCGQLFLARREAYERMGGHSVIRTTLHDGIKLPRAFRAAGLPTDLCDATDLATCRMYRSGGELWRGLAKNATEGLAAPALIVPITVLLVGGQILPISLAVLGALSGWTSEAEMLAVLATFFSYLPRLLGALRFRQSWLSAILHPLGIVILLAIQWSALIRTLIGQPATWKGRAYQNETSNGQWVDSGLPNGISRLAPDSLVSTSRESGEPGASATGGLQ